MPEIDMSGHTNAALASYPELTCDGEAPELYTGIQVGFSYLCVEKEETYAFITDVVRELAARTPGPYFHLGGDEVHELTEEQYIQFMERAHEIIAAHGKRVMGKERVCIARDGLHLLDYCESGCVNGIFAEQHEAGGSFLLLRNMCTLSKIGTLPVGICAVAAP